MKDTIRVAGLLLLSLLLFGFASPASGSAARLETGEMFPDLLLPSLESGAPTSLREFRGQKLVLHVFASW